MTRDEIKMARIHEGQSPLSGAELDREAAIADLRHAVTLRGMKYRTACCRFVSDHGALIAALLAKPCK